MTKKIAITTSSFGKCGPYPLEFLKRNAIDVILNKEGRTLRSQEILKLLKGCLGVIAGTEIYNKEILEKLEGLEVISRCGGGTDNIDLDVCKARGIKVFNTPDGSTRAVAELTIGLILDLLRNISMMDREIRKGTWQKRMGGLFAEKEVGIVGLGRIGKEVARLSSALGAKVFYWDSFKTEPDFSYASKKEFKNLLSHCDVISLHLPLTSETKDLIGEEELSLMKKSALLINCSRGGMVDEDALYAALKNGRLAGAAIDVFETEPYQGPLRELDSVILTPHIGSYAKEARLKMESMAVDNLIQGLKEIELIKF